MTPGINRQTKYDCSQVYGRNQYTHQKMPRLQQNAQVKQIIYFADPSLIEVNDAQLVVPDFSFSPPKRSYQIRSLFQLVCFFFFMQGLSVFATPTEASQGVCQGSALDNPSNTSCNGEKILLSIEPPPTHEFYAPVTLKEEQALKDGVKKINTELIYYIKGEFLRLQKIGLFSPADKVNCIASKNFKIYEKPIAFQNKLLNNAFIKLAKEENWIEKYFTSPIKIIVSVDGSIRPKEFKERSKLNTNVEDVASAYHPLETITLYKEYTKIDDFTLRALTHELRHRLWNSYHRQTTGAELSSSPLKTPRNIADYRLFLRKLSLGRSNIQKYAKLRIIKKYNIRKLTQKESIFYERFQEMDKALTSKKHLLESSAPSPQRQKRERVKKYTAFQEKYDWNDYYNELIKASCDNDTTKINFGEIFVKLAQKQDELSNSQLNLLYSLNSDAFLSDDLPLCVQLINTIDASIRPSLISQINLRKMQSKVISQSEKFLFISEYDAYLYQYFGEKGVHNFFPELEAHLNGILNTLV